MSRRSVGWWAPRQAEHGADRGRREDGIPDVRTKSTHSLREDTCGLLAEKKAEESQPSARNGTERNGTERNGTERNARRLPFPLWTKLRDTENPLPSSSASPIAARNVALASERLSEAKRFASSFRLARGQVAKVPRQAGYDESDGSTNRIERVGGIETHDGRETWRDEKGRVGGNGDKNMRFFVTYVRMRIKY